MGNGNMRQRSLIELQRVLLTPHGERERGILGISRSTVELS